MLAQMSSTDGLLNQVPTAEHLNCFQFFAVMNFLTAKSLKDIHHYFLEDKLLEGELLSQRLGTFLRLLIHSTTLLSRKFVSIYIPV